MKARDFEILSRNLRPRMILAASRLLDDSMDVEDTVQDAMLKLWTLRDELDSCRSVEAFAVVMVRRMALDVLRSRKPGRFVPVDDDIASIPSAEQEMIDRQSHEDVDRIMSGLPEAQRTLLMLRHKDGYSNAAIASLLGCSEGAVRTALSRARRHVAEMFGAMDR